jgi:hypothetical protein
MDLKAIMLARVVTLFELQTLDPTGKASVTETLKQIAGRYSFTRTPQTIAELDFQKGVELVEGKLNQIRIDRFTIYSNGMSVDTRSSTEDSEEVLKDFLAFMRTTYGASVQIVRQFFVSQIVFRSDLQFSSLNPILKPLAEHLAATVSADMKHSFVFEPSGLIIGADVSQTKLSPGLFTLERRSEIPFSEKMYFSSAPLRTAEHFKVLEKLETSLSR